MTADDDLYTSLNGEVALSILQSFFADESSYIGWSIETPRRRDFQIDAYIDGLSDDQAKLLDELYRANEEER